MKNLKGMLVFVVLVAGGEVVASASINDKSIGAGVQEIVFNENFAPQTFNSDSKEYQTIHSQDSYGNWLDSNFDALQVAISATDAASYGDLSQWGWAKDGQQAREASAAAVQVASINPNQNKFIKNAKTIASSAFTGGTIIFNGKVYKTVKSPTNNTGKIWLDRNVGADAVATAYNQANSIGTQYVGGNNADNNEKAQAACPAGFRTPSIAEFKTALGTNNNRIKAARDSFLHLPGNVNNFNNGNGFYWTNEYTASSYKYFYLTENTIDGDFGAGTTVRCIYDNGDVTSVLPATIVSTDTVTITENRSNFYTIRLGVKPTGNVIITPQSQNTAATVSAAITFSTTNWNTVQTINITAVADINTANEIATITHTISGGDYSEVAVADVIGLTVDDNTGHIIFDGLVYREVVTPSGRTWLDRNLGATGTIGEASYGYLYQWGRGNDGHQLRSNTATTTVQLTASSPATSALVINNADWTTISATDRAEAWADGAANDICPSGFQVPSAADFSTESAAGDYKQYLSISNDGGYRDAASGSIRSVTNNKVYWTNEIDDTQSKSWNAVFSSDNSIQRTYSYSIRCINDPSIEAGPPTSLSVTANGTATVTLAWLPSRQLGYPMPTYYTLERSTTQDFAAIKTATVTFAVMGASTYTDSGLSVGSKYYYRVRAINSIGPSLNSPTLVYTHIIVYPPTITSVPNTRTAAVAIEMQAIIITAGGSTANYSIIPSLAQGLVFATPTTTTAGSIFGTPTMTANTTYSIIASNIAGTSIATVTITVHANTRLIINPTTVAIDEGRIATYTVELAAEPVAEVTITPAITGDTIAVTTTAITFTTSNWETSQTITITATEDDNATSESATIAHIVQSSDSFGEYAFTTIADAIVTIIDNDRPIVNVSPVQLQLEENTSQTYTISLATEPTAEVTITPNDNVATATSPSALSFTPGNWQTSQTIAVTAIQDDNSTDGSANITHTVLGGDYGARGNTPSVMVPTITVTITDNDEPKLNFIGGREIELEDGELLVKYLFGSRGTGLATSTSVLSKIRGVFRNPNLDFDVDENNAADTKDGTMILRYILNKPLYDTTPTTLITNQSATNPATVRDNIIKLLGQ